MWIIKKYNLTAKKANLFGGVGDDGGANEILQSGGDFSSLGGDIKWIFYGYR